MSIVLDTGDFTVAAGEIVALLGANGSGKTTLMETILGFRTSRTIRLFSQDVTSLPVERRVALGVGYVPERRRLFASLTVAENLEASSCLPAAQRRRRVDEMLAAFPMLGERPDARAWLLSGGQQQMLALARALMDRPRLLLLDEPTRGVDVGAKFDIYSIIREMTAKGMAVFLASSDLPELLGMADRIAIMRDGVITVIVPARDLTEQSLLNLCYGRDAAPEAA